LIPFRLTKNHEAVDVFKDARKNEDDENQDGDEQMNQ